MVQIDESRNYWRWNSTTVRRWIGHGFSAVKRKLTGSIWFQWKSMTERHWFLSPRSRCFLAAPSLLGGVQLPVTGKLRASHSQSQCQFCWPWMEPVHMALGVRGCMPKRATKVWDCKGPSPVIIGSALFEVEAPRWSIPAVLWDCPRQMGKEEVPALG